MTGVNIGQAMDFAANLRRKGQLAEAAQAYRHIIEAAPTCDGAFNGLGMIAVQSGRHAEALQLFDRAISLNPGFAPYLFNQAMALMQCNRSAQALAAMKRAVELAPGEAQSHYGYALALYETGDLKNAEAACRKAISLQEQNERAHALLGLILRSARRPDEAIRHFRRALELRPDRLDVLNNLGSALLDQDRIGEALTAFSQVILRQPDVPEAHNNLANVLRGLGRFDEAEAEYRRALELRPGSIDTENNIGSLFAARGDWAKAEQIHRAVIARDPNFAAAHWDLSLLLLGAGDYENGWREYEWRWKVPELRLGRRMQSPRWNGESLAGKTILLHGEQGLGDTIQFARFIPQVAPRGGKTLLMCRPELLPLLGGMAGVDGCTTSDEPAPPHDVHCPLLSLPRVLGVTQPPLTQSYLQPDAQLAEKFSSDLAGDQRRKIGLVWNGKTYPDPFRSIPSEKLKVLENVKNVRWVSLQTAAKLPAGMELLDLGSKLKNFNDTAAAMHALDLIITIDTASAHLAGALGKPAWVLLKRVADWRWGRDGDTCPWYPSLRLFRQERDGDWETPLARVVAALSES